MQCGTWKDKTTMKRDEKSPPLIAIGAISGKSVA
jgi:hypothetical protein